MIRSWVSSISAAIVTPTIVLLHLAATVTLFDSSTHRRSISSTEPPHSPSRAPVAALLGGPNSGAYWLPLLPPESPQADKATMLPNATHRIEVFTLQTVTHNGAIRRPTAEACTKVMLVSPI